MGAVRSCLKSRKGPCLNPSAPQCRDVKGVSWTLLELHLHLETLLFETLLGNIYRNNIQILNSIQISVLGKFLLRSTAFQNCLLHCFSIRGIFHRRNFPGGTFLGGIFLGGIYRSRKYQYPTAFLICHVTIKLKLYMKFMTIGLNFPWYFEN